MSIRLAGCVILDHDKKIYLLHRNKKGVVQWELPGGKIETGETPRQAAVRELYEETGAVVSISGYLGEATFIENGVSYYYSWFLAKVTKNTLSICEPETFDDLRSFSVAELASLRLSRNMQLFCEAVGNGLVKF